MLAAQGPVQEAGSARRTRYADEVSPGRSRPSRTRPRGRLPRSPVRPARRRPSGSPPEHGRGTDDETGDAAGDQAIATSHPNRSSPGGQQEHDHRDRDHGDGGVTGRVEAWVTVRAGVIARTVPPDGVLERQDDAARSRRTRRSRARLATRPVGCASSPGHDEDRSTADADDCRAVRRHAIQVGASSLEGSRSATVVVEVGEKPAGHDVSGDQDQRDRADEPANTRSRREGRARLPRIGRPAWCVTTVIPGDVGAAPSGAASRASRAGRVVTTCWTR